MRNARMSTFCLMRFANARQLLPQQPPTEVRQHTTRMRDERMDARQAAATGAPPGSVADCLGVTAVDCLDAACHRGGRDCRRTAARRSCHGEAFVSDLFD